METKVYPVKRFNAMQYRRGGWIAPHKSGYVAFDKRGAVYGQTKKLALQRLNSSQKVVAND